MLPCYQPWTFQLHELTNSLSCLKKKIAKCKIVGIVYYCLCRKGGGNCVYMHLLVYAFELF